MTRSRTEERTWLRRRCNAWKRNRKEAKESAHEFFPFDRFALWTYHVGLLFAPSWLFIDTAKRFQTTGELDEDAEKIERERANRTARYAAGWLVFLLLLWAISPASDFLAKALAIIAFFRLLEIGTTIIGFVLSRREPLIAGSLITIATLALQMALIFAIADHAFARSDFAIQPAAESASPQIANTRFDYLYISVTTMITLGNQYVPGTSAARCLELSAGISGVVLLGVVVARAIGLKETRPKTGPSTT